MLSDIIIIIIFVSEMSGREGHMPNDDLHMYLPVCRLRKLVSFALVESVVGPVYPHQKYISRCRAHALMGTLTVEQIKLGMRCQVTNFLLGSREICAHTMITNDDYDKLQISMELSILQF